jgi:FAD/FMN-containing dehydrogenase
MAALTYQQRKQQLAETLRAARGRDVRLAKTTSNLFRDRRATRSERLDVGGFDHVLGIDREAGYVDVEGMTTYAALTAECLKSGVMPAVVPQLKSITIGGAAAGCGIESSSFRYGLVHETLAEMEILLGDGSTVVATPDNEHRDLFFGFPNSYGTLGYALRLKAKVIPVKPYVKLMHLKFSDAPTYFGELARHCERGDVDFVDGVVFEADQLVLTIGQFVDAAPYVSDYRYERIYYRSLRERGEDYLTTEDYIWRWDTDWFWCSKNLLAQNPIVRRLYGPKRLNSVTYTKIMRWNSRWGLTRRLDALRGMHSESVIQDVEIPVTRAAEFLDFYHRTIPLLPVWICPTRAYDKHAKFDLYRLDSDTLYVNFGFWDAIRSRQQHPPGYYNKQVEAEVRRLGGMKSLYSDSYFSAEEFWQIYNKSEYDRLKRKYDATGALKDLYHKCVLKE